MYQLDEQQHEVVETLHVYVYQEKPQKPRWWNKDRVVTLLVGLMTLTGMIALCCIPTTPLSTVKTLAVPAHFLPVQNYSATVAIIPTGKKTYPATKATGTLTIYNGSFLTQQLPAGFLLTTQSGIEIQTDTTVLIPPGNPPSYGEATVLAYALTAGESGNIPAYALNQMYGSDIAITNLTAFTGGQNEYTKTFATPNDRRSALTAARNHAAAKKPAGLLAAPCGEKTTQPHLTVTVTWVCQFVTFTPPTGVQVLSAMVQGNRVLLRVRFVARHLIFVPK